ncbi:MAG: choice-of-anchor B family protein [Saprospiraceae bacterium]
MLRKVKSQSFVLYLILISISQINSQDLLNTRLVAHRTFDVNSNDIWGFEKDGIHYAVIGNFNRTSIFSLEKPNEPILVYEVFGTNSIWRDIKFYNDYLYVVADSGSDGLLIIDVSRSVQDISHVFYKPEIPLPTGNVVLRKSHNLFIDEKGFCYLAGSNVGVGGSLIFDLNSDPLAPNYVGIENFQYSHDAFVTKDTLYTSEIYRGQMAMYDVSDKSNIRLLGSNYTPNFFTHNVWGDGKNTLAFTTDERASAYVTAYDVSTPENIRELDRYIPAISGPEGVIPHNTHYLDGYLVTSWYTDGLRVLDVHKPDNMVEVAYYDTWEDEYICHESYHGNWGAYPYTNSNLVYASDIENGLFIVEVDYKRACYVEGVVTDINGKLMSNVKFEFDGDGNNINYSAPDGIYKTGTYKDGTVKLHISKDKYLTKTLEVTLERGKVLNLDVILEPISETSVTINLVNQNNEPIEGNIKFWNDSFSKLETVDGTKTINIPAVPLNAIIESWGYLPHNFENFDFSSTTTQTYMLTDGYAQVFDASDFWTNDNNEGGDWEIGIPKITTFNNRVASPSADSDDFGNFAMVTSNGIPGADCADVDGTPMVVKSRVLDLSTYLDPTLSFDLWSFTSKQDGNQIFTISFTNGVNEFEVFRYSDNTDAWIRFEDISIPNDVKLWQNTQIQLSAIDLSNNGRQSIFEVAIDNISIKSSVSSTKDFTQSNIKLIPNVIDNNIAYLCSKDAASYVIYNALGTIVLRGSISNSIEELNLQGLQKGLYYLQCQDIKSNNVKFLKL